MHDVALIKLLYKSLNFDNYCFEVFMKAKWKDEEIKNLFKLVEKNQKNNLPIMQSFREFGKLTNRNPLSVRNFYYAETKILADSKNLQQKIGIDVLKHQTQKFEHFDKVSETDIKEKIDSLKSKGYSTRKACMELSNGDIKQMLRIQNKYRNIQNKARTQNQNKDLAKNIQATVIAFPKQQTQSVNKNRLTDEDIKSLFMGLVKLVKENASSEGHEQAEKFLEETERQNRKRLVEIEQMKSEISLLKQQIVELSSKNKRLNTQLENYRMDYVFNTPRPDSII